MAPLPLDLVDTDRRDAREIHVRPAPGDGHVGRGVGCRRGGYSRTVIRGADRLAVQGRANLRRAEGNPEGMAPALTTAVPSTTPPNAGS